MPRPVGRPKQVTPPPADYPPLTLEQIALIAPLSSRGQPDMLNYLPTRLIPFAEAQARSWSYFYDGSACRKGHIAPRFISNKDICVDCRRVSRGKQPIGRTAGAPPRREYVRDGAHVKDSAAPSAVVVRQPEPDRIEKRFLEAYAATKNFEQACAHVGIGFPHMMGRLSWSSVFRAAVEDLENRLSITHVPAVAGDYEWTADKHFRFIEVYVDTGDIATARDSIGVTASEYYRELTRNVEFAGRVEEASGLAANVLEEKAKQLAIQGNDKLLTKILEAEKPSKYGQKLNVNMNLEARLTDDQLRHQILSGIRAGRIIDSGVAAVNEPPRLTQDAQSGEGTGTSSETESYLDLL